MVDTRGGLLLISQAYVLIELGVISTVQNLTGIFSTGFGIKVVSQLS